MEKVAVKIATHLPPEVDSLINFKSQGIELTSKPIDQGDVI